MTDIKQRNITLKKLARWTPSSVSTHSTLSKAHAIAPLSNDAPFNSIHHDKLQQGALYIIKIKQVSLAMFEGWNDDMCCFSILRSEVEPMRWSEARQLPGDFDIYDAFDECGNPPIHLWLRNLRVNVPSNWFSMFEEAKRKQRSWEKHPEEAATNSQQKQEQEPDYHDQPVPDNESMPISSDADVSLMHSSGDTTTSPSTTNAVDPSLLNQDDIITKVEGGSHDQASDATATMTPQPMSPTPQPMSPALQPMSPTPQPMSPTLPLQPPERSNSIMNREQIRRYLAPGQATRSNRKIDSSSDGPPTKEYLTTPLAAFNNDQTESNTSTKADLPYHSDRFSIHSGSTISKNTPSKKTGPNFARVFGSLAQLSK